MSKFEFMQPAVDEICRSLREEPHMWELSHKQFKKKGTNTVFQDWSDIRGLCSVQEIWTGVTWIKVFDVEQGLEIARAHAYARSVQASKEQQAVIDEVLNPSTNIKIQDVEFTVEKKYPYPNYNVKPLSSMLGEETQEERLSFYEKMKAFFAWRD